MVSFPDVLQGHDVGPVVTVAALLYAEPVPRVSQLFALCLWLFDIVYVYWILIIFIKILYFYWQWSLKFTKSTTEIAW